MVSEVVRELLGFPLGRKRFNALRAILEPLGAHLGESGGGSEGSWGALRGVRGRLGRSWGGLGSVLCLSSVVFWCSWGVFGAVLEPSWGHLGSFYEASWAPKP